MWLILFLQIFYFLMMLRYRKSWGQLARKTASHPPNQWPAVTIIVPFRNERKNLSSLIQSLKRLDYPEDKLAIILVNDHSEDDGAEVLKPYLNKQFKLIHLDLEKGKKAAITAGIDHASSEWILTTDADCVQPQQWIKCLVAEGLFHNAVMVCGMVQLEQHTNLLNQLQYLEGTMLQAIGAASLYDQRPLLNTGASLLFLKRAFQDVGGYASHISVPSGDDTFLMMEMMQHFPQRVIPCIDPSGIVLTSAPDSFSAMMKQRLRWSQKVSRYNDRRIQMIGLLITFSSIGTVWFWVTLLIDNSAWTWLTVALFLRFLSEYNLLNAVMQQRKTRLPLSATLLTSFLYPFITIITVLGMLFYRPTWKGRKL